MKALNEKEVGEIYDQGKEVMVGAYLRQQEQIIGLMERVSRLEAQANQNSQNSSKPPRVMGIESRRPRACGRRVTGGVEVSGGMRARRWSEWQSPIIS